MKKRILLIMAALVFLSGCAEEKPCVAEQGTICYETETGQYQIEDKARIRVTVENEAYGQALCQLWNQIHPEHPDVIEPVAAQSYDAMGWLSVRTDLAYLWSEEAALIADHFMTVQPELTETIAAHVPPQFGALLNAEGLRYVPMSYYGLVFSTNVTMLEALGYSAADENQDGLADDFDTFEKIFALADAWQGQPRTINELTVTAVFPVSFPDLWSSLVYLSAGGYRPFASQNALEPGFDSEAFLKALSFLREMGDHSLYLKAEEARTQDQVDDEPAAEDTEETQAEAETEPAEEERQDLPEADPQTAPEMIPETTPDSESETTSEEEPQRIYEFKMNNETALQPGWQYDVYLEKLISPFSMVGTWMFYNEQEDITQQDFLFSAMPTWEETPLAPLAKNKGYLISADTRYPSAANEVLRLIRSEAGLQAYLDTTDEILAVTAADRAENRPQQDPEASQDAKEKTSEADLLYLDFHTENRRQLSQAFAHSQEESMVAYQKDTSVRGWQMLEDLNVLQIMKEVFAMKKTPEQAQEELTAAAALWLEPYQLSEEELKALQEQQ